MTTCLLGVVSPSLSLSLCVCVSLCVSVHQCMCMCAISLFGPCLIGLVPFPSCVIADRPYCYTAWSAAGPIQRVTIPFKLLGLHLDAGLSWTIHINTIVSKASKRLYFLKQLRRAGVPPRQLFYFYTAVIRSVLEYASPLQSGTIPSPELSLNTWNQSRNEQYTSFSVLPAGCHILTFYLSPI